ncbi:MAG: hypothetical protein GKR87_14470 [Kiritimatiellae bacterium]|nr:hypothetical protein [Kiritimatiellia bacterium]
MMKLWGMSFCFLLMVSLTWAMKTPPWVNLNVQVVDEQGKAIESAQAGVGYPSRISGKGDLFKKLTDEEGRTSFSGSSFFKFRVKAEKAGYYDSYEEVTTFERVDKENVYSDQSVTLVLREVRNPMPMYAYKEIKAKLPVLGKAVGFDMMKADWVSPYGQGEVADILLEVAGEWNGYRDHDSLLTLHFQNKGDGYNLFKANGQSRLSSPYKAPLSDYVSNKSWRKMKRPIEGAISEWDSVDDVLPDANYILRVRTVLDEDDEVKQANYGKMYGDFKFWGATLDKYGYAVFSYYLNPTPNDRNLEFDPKRNLFKNLSAMERVTEP